MQGGGSISEQPLPPHKFGSHDIVDLKASKAPTNGPALAHGVVFRVKDKAIVVACEQMPDDELSQPLRLEKLANEVSPLSSLQIAKTSIFMQIYSQSFGRNLASTVYIIEIENAKSCCMSEYYFNSPLLSS